MIECHMCEFYFSGVVMVGKRLVILHYKKSDKSKQFSSKWSIKGENAVI